jgi:hypothetical protein
VKVAVSPETCQLPAIFGVSTGSGVCGVRAEEKVTLITEAPLTSRAPLPGLTETTVSGWAGAGALGAACARGLPATAS